MDPRITEANIDNRLKTFSNMRPDNKSFDFSYFGERTSLFFSFIILIILTIVLGLVSFGLFFVIIFLSLINLFVRSIRNKGQLVQVNSNNFPDLFRLVKVICYRLKLPLSPVYIVQNQDYNAYTMGFMGQAWVVVNSSIIEDFSPMEIAFVLGHEFAHIKKRHTTWLTIMSPASNTPVSLISSCVRIIFNLWSLKCEHTADRGGLIAVGNIDPAISALVKLATGKRLSTNVDWQKIVKDHESRDNIILKASELLGTHPFPAKRMKELYTFSQSKRFHLISQQKNNL
jgi:Zn-dependent protease with chaperone function